MNDIDTIKQWLGSGSINIFGLPFAGKDTQCENIARLLDAIVVGSGEILRSQEHNRELQDIMATGALIPSDMYFDIIVPFLKQERLLHKPLILSSVGRMKGEEEIIVEATNESDHPIKAVILLNLPEETVWERHNAAKQLDDRGDRRDDGGDEILANRIRKFNTQTVPVIDFYRAKGLLVEVDGTKDRETVMNEIVSALTRFATSGS